MKRLLPLLFAVVFAATAALGQTNPLYVTQDVPTVPAAPLLSCTGGTAMLPSEIYLYDPAAVSVYACALGPVPGDPDLDALHKLDTFGDFLFSVESPSNLAGFLMPPGSTAMPGDVIHYDSSLATFNLCFVAASVGIPSSRNVDAIFRTGGDAGPLVVSFDVPTILAPFAPFEPADLVTFLPSAAAVCPPAWALAAANPAFDASVAGAGIAIASNAIGADDDPAGGVLLAFDVPTTVAPPALPPIVPGQVVSFFGGAYAVYETKVGWPITSQDDFSSLANPGLIPPTLLVGKTGLLDTSPIVLSWSASCSEGASDYGIYEGKLGSWYSHTSAVIDDCNDAGGDLTETVTPAAGDRYYLIVPHNGVVEGSYGMNSFVAERPVGAVVCAAPQVITACPPP